MSHDMGGRIDDDILPISSRRYLPSIGDLVDRLSINQIKEVLLPEHKEQYAAEIQDILHDIDLILQNKKVDAKTIRAIVVMSQMNLHIWVNEAKCRAGIKEGNDLRLSHGLNGIRIQAKNRINTALNGGNLDHKADCLAAEFKDWHISWE